MIGLTADEYQRLLRSVGTHRSDRVLSPLEVAQLLQKALSGGSSRKACAEELQLGATQVTAFLNLLELAPDVQELADWGNSTTSTIAFSTLAQLNVLGSHEAQRRASEAILKYGLSWKEVVQFVQITRRSGRSIDESIEAVVRLRPQIEKRHVFIGSVKSEVLQEYLARKSQTERDGLFASVIRELFRDATVFSVRLGTRHFTIVGAADPAVVLGTTADELEESVTRLISARTLP